MPFRSSLFDVLQLDDERYRINLKIGEERRRVTVQAEANEWNTLRLRIAGNKYFLHFNHTLYESGEASGFALDDVTRVPVFMGLGYKSRYWNGLMDDLVISGITESGESVSLFDLRYDLP